MTSPAIGLLGLGYLGEELLRSFSCEPDSWATRKPGIKTSPPDSKSKVNIINFDWRSPADFHNLPDSPATLILTIPPLLKDRRQERERIQNWLEWMSKRRRQCQKLIYISSVGVYPNRNGRWAENSEFKPDSLKGLLRLDTEKILDRYFQSRVIRAGAIYGPKRNIGQRILEQKPIPLSDAPVHRVHVSDLARIVKAAVVEDSFPAAVNAVDLEGTPSSAVVEWLTTQSFFPGKQLQAKYQEGYLARKHKKPAVRRFVSNQLLLDKCKYRFLYPTYREGLKQIFNKA